MASGASRAGALLKGVKGAGKALKSTGGARKVVKITGAQRARISPAMSKLRGGAEGSFGKTLRKGLTEHIDKLQDIASVAGNLIEPTGEGADFQRGINEQLEEAREEQRNIAVATKRDSDYIRMEIAEREKRIRDLPHEFTYTKPVKGMGFYFILLIMIVKDIIAIILKIIGLIADVTVILGIIMWVITTIVDAVAYGFTTLYFFVNSIELTEKAQNIQTIGFLVALVPFIGLLPTETIAFILVRIELNKNAKNEAMNRMAQNMATLQEQINILEEELISLNA